MRDGITIGVTTWTVDGDGPETLAVAAELGFRAVHIDSGHPEGDRSLADPALRDAYAQAAHETGVTITAIAAGGLNDLGLSSRAGSHEAALAWQSVTTAIEAAVELGVPLVFLPSFRNGEIRDSESLRRTAEVLAATCDHAAGRVTIATENTLDAARHLDLLRAADRPALRVLFDTQNPALWGHVPSAMVGPLWSHLAPQVHAKDGRDGQFGDAVLGEGEAGFLASAAVLRSHGFAGVLICENEYRGDRRGNAARDLVVLRAAFDLAP